MKSDGLKFNLCCAARLLYRFGLSVGNAGHLSITIGENRMLVNRFGPSFATMTPADVLTMDFAGNVLEHDPSVKPYVNETIHLHGVIHRYNPHIGAVAHTHPPNTVTWTTFRKLPQAFDQESCLLADDIAIVDEEFTGLAQTEDRVRPFAEALGKKPVVLLPNHGAITTGPNIQSALFRMILLEGVCQRNISVGAAAQATGLTPHAIAPEHALTTKQELARIPILEPLWEDLQKRLRQTDSDLFRFMPESESVTSTAQVGAGSA
ncbi:MAG TPA: class II aldolase/adducin family protein [Candidatus Acidoferrales bacterium]|nr:class II aldolase/adducin family protein [Candidatus Acidoferrales bacterium]